MTKIIAFLAPFIFAMTGSLVSKIMSAIGIGVVSYVGFDILVGGLTSAALSSLGSGGEGVGFVVQASGFAEAIQILCSAYTTRVSLLTLKRLSVVNNHSW